MSYTECVTNSMAQRHGSILQQIQVTISITTIFNIHYIHELYSMCQKSKSTPVVQWLSYSPLDPRFAGSIPAGVDGFFQSLKILNMTSFGREGKPWVPRRRFTARKRTSSRNYSLWAKFVGVFTLYVGSYADDLKCWKVL